MSGQARTLLLVAAGVAVGAAHLALVLVGLGLRLWEDEAYNLTVPLNLLSGDGYSSAGVLSFVSPQPFDVRISTGPAVLLPAAAGIALVGDPVLGARLVVGVYYAALVVLAWVAGRRVGGPWAGPLAALSLVAYDTTRLPSPIQSPVDLLGEIPAAALMLAAVLAVARRPWLAGLLAGLAIQAKTLGAMVLPVLVVLVLLDARAGRWTRRLGRTVVVVALAAVPSLLYESVRAAVLGWNAYIPAALESLRFLRSGGQAPRDVSPGEKLVAFGESWFLPLPVAIAVTLAALLVFAYAARSVAPDRWRTPSALLAVAGLLLVGGSAVWWLTTVTLPAWPRHPSLAVLAGLPLLTGALVAAVRRLPARGARGTTVIAAAATAIALVQGVQWIGHLARELRPNYGETLAEQRDAAAQIAAAGVDVVSMPWNSALGAVILAGAEPLPLNAPPDSRLPQLWSGLRADDPASILDPLQDECPEVLVRTESYLICEAPGR